MQSANQSPVVRKVIDLLNSGATIPFIARYRKELTGGMDEVAIERIDRERLAGIELEKRRMTVLNRLAELRITNSSLIDRITNCQSLSDLEDLYIPYKPKKESRADKARKKGLEPLAKLIMSQTRTDLMSAAFRFTNHRMDVDEALAGAVDIIAEWVSESVHARNTTRQFSQRTALLTSKVVEKKKDDASNYRDYFQFSQPLRRVPGHRVLAILRAEREGFLKVKIEVDNAEILSKLERIFIKAEGPWTVYIKKAIREGYRRLLAPVIETELRKEAKERSDSEAIEIFSTNLRQLLLAPPLGSKSILAIDPGFRSGCKIVCLNAQGELLEHDTIFPHPPQSEQEKAAWILQKLIAKYHVEAIAVGNGTAGRETEIFVRKILEGPKAPQVFVVDESGASIYSASQVGRDEFPLLDLTVRGAISIGRRLKDPLSELVKIDPKSIGVGQYQHDVDQHRLRDSLNKTVLFAVNMVGVDVNTASKHLLQYVSGLGPKTADAVIRHRERNGPFRSREELLRIKGMGAKTFEQAAGFLRINEGTNPLDASAVHPERYDLVERIARTEGRTLQELIGKEEFCKRIVLENYVNEEVGLPTLEDIISELIKPGRDPRGTANTIQFDDRVKDIKDLHVRMVLIGRVTNITRFGAFVDIGIKQDGLVHISEISDRRISDPGEVLSLNQQIRVRVVEIDLERQRVGLSMRLTN